jgi:hypothetical protein
MSAFGSFDLYCEKGVGPSVRPAFNLTTYVSGATVFGDNQRSVIEWSRFAPSQSAVCDSMCCVASFCCSL